MRKTAIAFAMAVGFALSSSAFAVDSVQGVFMVVKGDVKVSHAGGSAEAAKVGGKVGSGDTIVAAADSRAKIVMSDKNVFNISPDSKFVIEKYTNSQNDKNVEVKVEFGKVRATVEEHYDGEKSKFNVKTPSAVAGVRGTDFVVAYSTVTKEASVTTLRGNVAWGAPGPNGTIQKPVFVKAGMASVASPSGAAAAPRVVPPAELDKVNTSTSSDSGGGQKSSSDSGSGSSDKKSGAKDGNSSSNSNSNSSSSYNSNSSSSGSSSSSSSSSSGSSGGSASGGAGNTATGGTASGGTTSGGSAASSSSGSANAGPAPASVGAAPGSSGPAAAAPPSMMGGSVGAGAGPSMVSSTDLGTAPIASGGTFAPPATAAAPAFTAPPPVATAPPPIPNNLINGATQRSTVNATINIISH